MFWGGSIQRGSAVPVEQDMHDSSTFAYEHYRPNHKMRYLIREKALSEIRVRILDHDGHPVHFNCIPFSVKFVVSIASKENIEPMQRDDAQTWPSHEPAEPEAQPQDRERSSSKTRQPRSSGTQKRKTARKRARRKRK